MKTHLRHWKLWLFFAFIISALVGSQTSPLKHWLQLSTLEALRDQILGYGWRGAAAYIAIYVGLLTLGLPNLPIQLAAAAIYGLWPAFLMMYVGVNLGALSAFGFSRALGRKSLEELWGHKLSGLNGRIEKGGFRFILALRLIPLVPFNAINYASGVSKLEVKHYITANLIGTLPLTFLHVACGDFLRRIW